MKLHVFPLVEPNFEVKGHKYLRADFERTNGALRAESFSSLTSIFNRLSVICFNSSMLGAKHSICNK